MASRSDDEVPPLPEGFAHRLARPFARFLHVESASGAVLVVCTAIALLAANTGLAEDWEAFWSTSFRIAVGGAELDHTLHEWVNDALMAIFFFVIGLEIKREIVAGELRDPRKVVLPLAAAAGGAITPAAIYLALRAGTPGEAGWAIPMATDIAFVVGGLALLGPRVPRGLKVMLLSLAIADDIIAVVVIALFYTDTVYPLPLAGAACGLALVYALNRSGVRSVSVYVVVGAGIWFATLESGVHPTVAGAVLGLMTPATAWVGRDLLLEAWGRVRPAIADRGDRIGDRPRPALERLRIAAREAMSPLERLEARLHPWSGFAIMPVFALANAGVNVSAGAIASPEALAVGAGLVIGKPVGIVAASWLAVRLRWGRLPEGTPWSVLLGAGFLAGIGFTMSLFVASLSFEGEMLESAKSGVLVASLVSGVVGFVVLRRSLRRHT